MCWRSSWVSPYALAECARWLGFSTAYYWTVSVASHLGNQISLFAACYICCLLKKCWTFSPTFLSCNRICYICFCLLVTMLPVEIRHQRKQHKLIDTLAASFAVSNKVFHLRYRSFVSSVIIHETVASCLVHLWVGKVSEPSQFWPYIISE